VKGYYNPFLENQHDKAPNFLLFGGWYFKQPLNAVIVPQRYGRLINFPPLL